MAGDRTKVVKDVAETQREIASLAKRHRVSKEVVKYMIAKYGHNRAVLEKALENQKR